MGFVEFQMIDLNCMSNHNRYVSINEYESGLAAIICGVPQGLRNTTNLF